MKNKPIIQLLLFSCVSSKMRCNQSVPGQVLIKVVMNSSEYVLIINTSKGHIIFDFTDFKDFALFAKPLKSIKSKYSN